MPTVVFYLLIIFAIFIALFVSSIVLIIIKKTKKIGFYTLLFTIIITPIAVLLVFMPRSYTPTYLELSLPDSTKTLRQKLDSAGLYFGSIATVTDMKLPRFANTFNSITPENALKMSDLMKKDRIGEYDFSQADSIVNTALSLGYRVRGHVLVWGHLSDKYKLPDLDEYLNKFPTNERKEILTKLMYKHIDTVLHHFRGKIKIWDVVNEPFDYSNNGNYFQSVYYRYLGEEYIYMAFKRAYAKDSTIKLYLNEQLGDYTGKNAQNLIILVKKMKEQGVPIHGVGIQSHILFHIPPIEELKAYITQITELGLEVEITELDARLRLFGTYKDPYMAQAQYYNEIIDICRNNPLCTGITFWGYTDKHCWIDRDMKYICPKPNEPYLFDAHLRPKPLYYILHKKLP
ncbi:MAG: endo-1,4-beta-xylanase [Bacteroidales bacterium]